MDLLLDRKALSPFSNPTLSRRNESRIAKREKEEKSLGRVIKIYPDKSSSRPFGTILYIKKSIAFKKKALSHGIKVWLSLSYVYFFVQFWWNPKTVPGCDINCFPMEMKAIKRESGSSDRSYLQKIPLIGNRPRFPPFFDKLRTGSQPAGPEILMFLDRVDSVDGEIYCIHG